MATQDRFPTGIGAQDTWTSSTGSAKYLDVDDAAGAPDDGTSYIYRQASDATQLFTFSAFDITSTAVSHLRITLRAQRTAAGTVNLGSRLYFAAGGQNTITTVQPPVTWTTYTHDALVNPRTGVTWTEAEIEGSSGVPANNLTQFGVIGSGLVAGEEIQVTQVYATVDYTPATADLSREVTADGLKLSESAAAARDLEQTIPADGLKLSASIDATRDLERAVTDDALNVTENSAETAIDLLRNVTADGLAVSESATPAMDLRQALTDDALAVSDSVDATIDILETLATDALKVSESVAAVFDLLESIVAEGVMLADSAEAALAAEPGVDLSVYFTQPGPLLPIMAA